MSRGPISLWYVRRARARTYVRKPIAATDLDAQLEDQTRRFLADANKGLRLDGSNSTVLVSKIFAWYGADFAQALDPSAASAGRGRAERGVIVFVLRHSADPGVRETLWNPGTRLGYLPYDWTLNDQARRAGARSLTMRHSLMAMPPQTGWTHQARFEGHHGRHLMPVSP